MSNTYKLSGGEKLKEYLTLLAAKAKNSALLNVGFPEGGTEPDGESTPMVAFLNEFGRTVRVKNPHTEMSQGRSVEVVGDYYQAPRPFFRNMISAKSPTWGEDLGVLLKAKDYDAVEALGLLGEEIRGQLVSSIQELQSPPLAPSTIKAKGFPKPLINTGAMWQGTASWVESTKE
jgi:hypothetical protein